MAARIAHHNETDSETDCHEATLTWQTAPGRCTAAGMFPSWSHFNQQTLP